MVHTNNGREEVLERLGEQTDVLHEDKQIKTVIAHAELDTIPDRLFLVLIGLVDIAEKAPRSKGLLLVAEP